VITQPPEHPVCKKFLDQLLDLVQEIEIPLIYAHGDEQDYACLCRILWKNLNIYKDVIVLMGGFHQLRVMQKIFYKRHAYKGYRNFL